MTKPFILSPAGSFDALRAAVNAGADEVYFGLGKFNARYNARNFSDEELAEAIRMCRILGVKTNITMNTLVTDKESVEVLDAVYNAACLGADAFIVQDLGLARRIKQEMPSVVLHASTQCACHNADGAKRLSELGFSRVVLAREMPMDEIRKVVNLGIETEIFVHGALCVCHSGMCLMSSVIGKRSGNRGLCAQPCRLPYGIDKAGDKYPLSLKDLSLSGNIEDILSLGVTSLKIEGRMKSPEYVYGTTSIWRSLVDGGKNATAEQVRSLENVFSRGGFTDKYFNGAYVKDNRSMYGVRSSDDKQNTRNAEKEISPETGARKRKIGIRVCLAENENARVFASCDGVTAETVSDFVCSPASKLPVDEAEVKKAVSKLGNTLFYVEDKDVEVEISGSVFLSKSMLNALRRDVVSALEEKLAHPVKVERYLIHVPLRMRKAERDTLTLVSCKSIESVFSVQKADYISLPLAMFDDADGLQEALGRVKRLGACLGVRMPRVVFDSEMKECERLLALAKNNGAEFCEVSNVGTVDVVKKSGLALFGGIGLNVFNSSCVSVLEDMGFKLITLSPELNEAQMRDIEKGEGTLLCAFVKGRLPVMVLESCIFKAQDRCRNKDCTDEPCGILHDRIGMEFPVFAEKRLASDVKACRNIICNSVETDILSKKEKLDKMNVDAHLILV